MPRRKAIGVHHGHAFHKMYLVELFLEVNDGPWRPKKVFEYLDHDAAKGKAGDDEYGLAIAEQQHEQRYGHYHKSFAQVSHVGEDEVAEVGVAGVHRKVNGFAGVSDLDDDARDQDDQVRQQKKSYMMEHIGYTGVHGTN